MGHVIFEGSVGIFGFADLANVWSGFSVFALENCGFAVWGPPRFAGFLECSLWFSVFVRKDGDFSVSLSSASYGFAKEVTSPSRAKTGVIPS